MVAYLAAPVVAIYNHSETSVKYPAFTDPPDKRDPPNRTDRIPVNMYLVQIFIADYTDPADQ